MSNIIEEFVIKFLTDSKEAKKGANDLDKFLDNFNKNRHKKDLKEHESFLKAKKKLEDKYYKGSGSPTSPLKPNSPRNPKLTAEQLVDKAIEARQKKELKREIDLLKIKENTLRKERKLKAAMDNQTDMIRRSAGFKLANEAGRGGKYEKEMQRLVDEKDLKGLRDLRYSMSGVRKDMIRYRKEVNKTNIAQKGLTDSTRNMIRSYASLYAIFEGTGAIKRVGMSFQGMEASMLAASGSSEAAAKDMMFINGIVDEMGLSLKDTTDAFVKFKFASKGKISQTEQEDLFTGLSMFGTALKVDDESMKRSQKALIQIDDYCLAA